MDGFIVGKNSRVIVHLETYTSYEDYVKTKKLKVPIESFIIYCIYKYSENPLVDIRLIPVTTTHTKEMAAVMLGEENLTYIKKEFDIPWTVALCTYPVILCEDVIVSGLCAVARHICYYPSSRQPKEEHEEGILGFRRSCLQSPNEVSIWTKYCEVDIIKSVHNILTFHVQDKNLQKFENHLKKPVKLHNLYKVARKLQEILDAEKKTADTDLEENSEKQENAEDQKYNEQVDFQLQPHSTPLLDCQLQADSALLDPQFQAESVQLLDSPLQADSTQLLDSQLQADSAQLLDSQLQADSTQLLDSQFQAESLQLLDSQLQADSVQLLDYHSQTDSMQLLDFQVQAGSAQCLDSQLQADSVQEIGSELQADIAQLKYSQPEANEQQQVNVEDTEELANYASLLDLKDSEESSLGTTRTPKSRKWKSNKKKAVVTDKATKLRDLNIDHKFAEGPFLTLADLVLLPSYYVIIHSIGEERFKTLLPHSHRWYTNVTSVTKVQETFMQYLKKFNLTETPLNIEFLTYKDVSLYKSDKKRHNPKKRSYTKEKNIEKSLNLITEEMVMTLSPNDFKPAFKWDDIPEHANPNAGYLPENRCQRKLQQLENIALVVLSLATEGDLIVDFCCGGGHLGILLAHLLPLCTIILLENKERSLALAKQRVQKLKLKNVYFYQCNADYFIGKFDIGVGLHACGIATDLIMDKCFNVNAKFVVCPCCYGSLHETDRMVFPRSLRFTGVSLKRYMCIGHTADQTHADCPLAARGARCMAIIDSDRGRLAEELGYKVTLMQMKPPTCSPKNHILIGIPSED